MYAETDTQSVRQGDTIKNFGLARSVRRTTICRRTLRPQTGEATTCAFETGAVLSGPADTDISGMVLSVAIGRAIPERVL